MFDTLLAAAAPELAGRVKAVAFGSHNGRLDVVPEARPAARSCAGARRSSRRQPGRLPRNRAAELWPCCWTVPRIRSASVSSATNPLTGTATEETHSAGTAVNSAKPTGPREGPVPSQLRARPGETFSYRWRGRVGGHVSFGRVRSGSVFGCRRRVPWLGARGFDGTDAIMWPSRARSRSTCVGNSRTRAARTKRQRLPCRDAWNCGGSQHSQEESQGRWRGSACAAHGYGIGSSAFTGCTDWRHRIELQRCGR